MVNFTVYNLTLLQLNTVLLMYLPQHLPRTVSSNISWLDIYKTRSSINLRIEFSLTNPFQIKSVAPHFEV